MEHIRRSPLTVNFFTSAAPNILKGGYLNRAERSFGTQDSNKAFNPNYINPQYASDRSEVEQTMHDMPPMHPHFVPEDLGLEKRGIPKPDTTAAGGAFLPYIEAQILGQIDLSRDVSKIVIDEDDLDLWAQGQLKRDTLDTLPPRSKSETKAMFEAHAERLGIRIEYIRTGRNPQASELAGPYMTEQEHPWRVASERALTALLERRWDAFVPVAMALDKVSVGAGSRLTPYAVMDLAPLSTMRERASELSAGRRDNAALDAQTSALADEILTFLHESDIDRKYANDQGILLKETMRALVQCGFELLSRQEALEAHARPDHTT